jgi:glycerol-3-phosphate dehydrogenase
VLPDPPGGRPTWLLRLGLFLYDRLAGGSRLPRSRRVARGDPAAASLKPGFNLLDYWDAWVDDARLVVLNALDAAERGAEIATRTELLSARRDGVAWTAEFSGGRRVRAGAIVNAAGPWVTEVLHGRLGGGSASRVRLVKGSHIVVPRLWDGDHAFILQQPDGRVVFALPWLGRTLLGTTDMPVERPEDAAIEPGEAAYLCAAANAFFTRPTMPADVIWSYAGVRSLHDDGSAQAKDVTRDYRLELDSAPGPKLLSVFGGKLTTARALAEEALGRLGIGGTRWTAASLLPGGEPGMPQRFDWLPEPMAARMSRAYGGRLPRLLDGASAVAELGRHFGGGLYEVEVRYLMEQEFARTADDVLWRRTKLGLELTQAEQEALADYMGR